MSRTSPRANLAFFVLSVLCQVFGFGAGLGFREGSLYLNVFSSFGTSWIALASLLVCHSVTAFFVAKWLKLPAVWQYFNLLIAPCVVLYEVFGLPSEVLVIAVIVSVLIYLPTLWTRVPFYPTSSPTYEEILNLLPADRSFSFIDLGCGFGRLLMFLSRRRPLGKFVGVEISPLPLLISWIRSLFGKNLKIAPRSLWKTNCSDFDYVYAFLAPPPMPLLWEKLKGEMKPEATFICNSFPVPATPDRTISIADKRACILYIYRKNSA